MQIVGAACRRAHKVYEEHAKADGLKTGQDAKLPSGKIPDAIDPKNNIVRELKPDTPSGIAKGERQLEGYKQELESTTGEKWDKALDLYQSAPR